MKRVFTGISGMNVLLMGGLPRASMILVIGRPRSGKSTLGIRFLYEGLLRKQPAILISTSLSIDTLLKEIILTYNWNSKVLSKLIYLDCHSWMAGISRERYSADLTKLREINITFNSIIKNQSTTPQHDARLVIDTFSDLLLYNPSNLALEFLKDLRYRLFEYKITSLILVEEGAHDDRIVSSLESITDETIRLKIGEVFLYTHEKLY